MKINKPSPMGPKVTTGAAIYLRVSTEEQAESGLGLAAQEFACRKLAATLGLEVVAVFSDPGVSGGIPFEARPAGKALLEAARSFGAIVVLDDSRLGRDVEFNLRALRLLQEARLRVHYAETGRTAEKSFESRMSATLNGLMAESYRDQVKKKTLAAMATLRRQGKKTGGLVPFGFDVAENGRLVRNSDEAEALELIRRLHGKGASLRAIAAELAARGILTKSGRSTWAPKVLAGVIRRAEAA
jgi:DNA invertase Pin-like site-specific DNA recombinase